MPVLWITPEELPADIRDDPAAQEACEAASELLWSMSGRRFSGVQTTTEVYGRNLPLLAAEIAKQGVSRTDLRSVYLLAEDYSDDDFHRKLRLRGRPVRDIASVETVSGVVVDPNSYVLENHTTLVFDHYLTEEYQITYSYGTPPPTAGKMAARTLAYQFALLWGNREEECALPDRVTNVSREGVTWTLLDNQDFIAELRTGIYAVDLFLKSVNPHKATQRAKIFSPDIPRGRTRR